MKINPIDVLVALGVTIVYAAPVAGLLWFSWRSVITGLLATAAFTVFMFTLLAIGGMGWQPSQRSPFLTLAVGWTIAAILGAAAYWLAGKGFGLKAMNIVAGFLVMAWMVTFYNHVALAWWAVANAESKVERMRQADARDGIPARQRLRVTDAKGTPREIELLRNRDVLYIEPGTDASARALRLVNDWDDLHDIMQERRLTVVTDPSAIGTATRGAVSYRPADTTWTVDAAPAFYDRRTGAFSITPRRWLTEVLELKPKVAERVYRRHFGSTADH
jgi:hypothetical protein